MSVSTAADHAADHESAGREAGPDTVSETQTGWVWHVTALSVLLGVLVGLGIRTTERMRAEGVPSTRLGVPATVLTRFREQNDRLRQEISGVREQIAEYRAGSEDANRSQELLERDLQEYQALTGYWPVKGPGLRITLRHSTLPRLSDVPAEEYLLDNDDINGLISELWAAGAEAIAIAGAGAQRPQRFIVTTTVVGSGQSVVVNGQALAAPYEILAIGNPRELRAALAMPDGIVEIRGLDVLDMIEIEEAQQLVLPAYSGASRS